VQRNRPHPPTALLLDALGTLVALEPPSPLLRRELAVRFGLELSEAQSIAALTAEITYYRAHLHQGRDASSLAALHFECAEALRAGMPCPAVLADVDTASLTAALLASLRFTAYPDAAPALAAARAGGQTLVVVSNWDISLAGVLGRVGLAPLLDGVLTAAELGVRKPSSEIFMRALAVAGVSPNQAMHVGDSIEEDVAGARAAGIEAVLLRRDGGPGPSGVRTIASLDELA
jgi:putative hydrolase of the HAD superfamily